MLAILTDTGLKRIGGGEIEQELKNEVKSLNEKIVTLETQISQMISKEKITNSQSISEAGMVLDAMQNNANISGSLRNLINQLSGTTSKLKGFAFEAKQIPGNDANNAIESGIYANFQATNMPGEYGPLVVFEATEYVFQIFAGVLQQEFYFRVRREPRYLPDWIWSEWYKLAKG